MNIFSLRTLLWGEFRRKFQATPEQREKPLNSNLL